MDIDSIHNVSSPFPEAISMNTKGFSFAINDPVRAKVCYIDLSMLII